MLFYTSVLNDGVHPSMGVYKKDYSSNNLSFLYIQMQ